MQRAFSVMAEGRPGPVVVDLPMNVQAEAADVELSAPESRRPAGRPREMRLFQAGGGGSCRARDTGRGQIHVGFGPSLHELVR